MQTKIIERNGRKYQIETEHRDCFCDLVRVYEFIGERVLFCGKAITNDVDDYVEKLLSSKKIYTCALKSMYEQNDGFHCVLVNFDKEQSETSVVFREYTADEVVKELIKNYDCAVLQDVYEEIESEDELI